MLDQSSATRTRVKMKHIDCSKAKLRKMGNEDNSILEPDEAIQILLKPRFSYLIVGNFQFPSDIFAIKVRK